MNKILLYIFLFANIPNILIADDMLLQSSNFTYLGAFRVPKQDMGGPQYQGLAYGGSAIAYNPSHNSLFIVGHTDNQQVAEISIPVPINSTVLSNLNTASVLQNLVDITEGNRTHIKSGGVAEVDNRVQIGGILVYNDELIGSAYNYYDGEQTALLSHFKSSATLSTSGDFLGMYEVGSKPDQVPQAGFVAGYMTSIPSNWQTALGGKVLTGQSALSVLARTSSGPSAFAFNPSDLGLTPAPASPLVYYPIDHQTIGTYYTSQTLYNKGSHHSGVIFPSGTKSIVYFGKQGLGVACYGPGTSIQAEDGNRYNYAPPNNTCGGVVMTDTNDPCCYDPVDLSKGAHAYPYSDYAWAYDADDFARVKAGGRIVDNPSANLVDGVSPTSPETYKPWHIKPYATWAVTLPTIGGYSSGYSGASAYDEVNKKLYIVQVLADESWPLVHVYSVAGLGQSGKRYRYISISDN